MKSLKRKLKSLSKEEELVLKFTISEEDGELIKRLEKIVTTHKLPNKNNNSHI